MKKKILFILCFSFFLKPSIAYIPAYPMILSHLAHSQGKGAYQIIQELSFKQGVEPILLTETWWILGSQEIRLDVRANKTQLKDLYLRFLYKRNKKIFKDENNKLQSRPIPYYHLDRPFHLRSSSKLKKLFSVWKAAPFSPPERKEGVGFDPFIRLRRQGGTIQYQIGQDKAQVWLEQDEFVIRSWKWASGAVLLAWDYKVYPRHLFFPSQRIFRQKNSSELKIQVKTVKSIKANKNWTKKSLLSKKNKISKKLSSIEKDQIRKFYEKYR